MSGRGRGRGRGRGAVPPSVAAAGPFGRGDSNIAGPSVTATPRAEPGVRYPTTSLPQPVDALTEADKLMIKHADTLTQYMRSSPFFLAPANTQTLKVDRYSDKYLTHLQLEERKGKIFAIDTDLSFFPEELQTVYDPEKAKKLASMPQAKASLSFGDALAKLRELEKSEAEAKGPAGSDEEDGENEDEVVYDEEEFEDETDYNFSYFDNGEDYGDHDDGDEGPVY